MKRLFAILTFFSVCILVLQTFAAVPVPSASLALSNEINGAPCVIPAVQEWEGGKGSFVPHEGMSICLGSGGSYLTSSDREVILEFFEDTFGYETRFVNAPPASGDIYLLYSDDKTLPDGGYVLEASSIIKLSSRGSLGFLYGMITFLQCAAAEGSFPIGTVRDYPQYEVRAGMLDVARVFLPLGYVESVTKYFAWFKMNEIHLHVNDNGTGFSAFRLESDVEGLTSKDGYYTKEEYRAFQKRAEKYHVSVITEISTPAHSGCFASVVPELMLDSSHLDVTNPETVRFVETLLDEYIGGSHPVFLSGKVHLGADEYPSGYEEAVVAYLDELVAFCASRKCTPRFWGTFGGEGYSSNLKNVSKANAECNYFAVSLSDGQTLMDMGIGVVNSCAPVLNCVPGGNAGFADYVDVEDLYGRWYVHYLGTGASSAVDSSSKLLKGASFSLWNDLSYLRGYSKQDIFDRMRYLVAFVSEKTWTGDRTAEHTAADFMRRFETVSAVRGSSFPAGLPSGEVDEETIQTYEWIGFPYALEADVVWDGRSGESTILEGDGGRLAVGGDGTLFFRKDYGFRTEGTSETGEKQFNGLVMSFEYRLTAGMQTHVALYGTGELTVLVVDGVYAFTPKSMNPNGYNQSMTFCLPMRYVGSEGVSVSELSVSAYPDDFEEQRADGNLALRKQTQVRTPDGDSSSKDGRAAVDGSTDTVLTFPDDRDEQELVIDIGSVHSINQVVLRFADHVPSYEIALSENGTEYHVIYETEEGAEGGKKDDVLQVPLQKAQFVRFRQRSRIYSEDLEAFRSGSLSEVEIYGLDSERYENLLEEAGRYPDDEQLNRSSAELSAALLKKRIYLFEVETLCERIEERIATLDEEARIRAEREESERLEESRLNESRQQEEENSRMMEEEAKRKNPLPWILFGACVLAVAAAVVLFLRKNRSNH